MSGFRKPGSVNSLADMGRTRLSEHFFLRDFLFSDIAAIHGLSNIPDDPELAIAAGSRLCQDLLEPLQETFGRIAIRSAFRSEQVNGFGHQRQLAGKVGYNCASNEFNRARHTWDRVDKNGNMGATACIVVPYFWDRFHQHGDWQKLAWWIHDHLPYSEQQYFPRFWAFNLTWNEVPAKKITSYVAPRGILTKPGMPNHSASHEQFWSGILP